MVDVLHWSACAGLLLVWVVAGASNALIVLLWLLKRRRASLIPIVGGLAGAAGLLLSPLGALHKWWWVPPVVDPGTLPLVVPTVVWVVCVKLRRWWRNV